MSLECMQGPVPPPKPPCYEVAKPTSGLQSNTEPVIDGAVVAEFPLTKMSYSAL